MNATQPLPLTTLSPRAERIYAFILDASGEATRTNINRDLFASHVAADDLDAALGELECAGLIASETRPRESTRGTPTKVWKTIQPRQAPTVDAGVIEAGPHVPEAPAPQQEPASAPLARSKIIDNTLATLTRLKTERAALKYRLGERRAALADLFVAAELGDVEAIAARDAFPAEEQAIETRLRQLEPTIEELGRRFAAAEGERRARRVADVFTRVEKVMPARVHLARQADELVAQLGTCMAAIETSHRAMIATLHPHLTADEHWILDPDPGVLMRTVVGRLLAACRFDVNGLQELTGSGYADLLRQAPIVDAITAQNATISSRRPFGMDEQHVVEAAPGVAA